MRSLFLLLLSSSLALADFSYEQRSQITGGAMAGMMKLAGTFSKKLREPMSTWTYVKGNKVAHVTGTSSQIFDIDAETVTHVDHEKKTYSVMTFAQMREAMAKMGSSLKAETSKEDVETHAKVDVKETGRKKLVANQNTSETLLSFIYEMKDKQGKESAQMETQSSSWLATNVAGWKEYSEAQQRLGVKMARGMAAGSPMGAGPGMQPGMSESWGVLAAKMAQMNGVPMLQIVRMGPAGQLPPTNTMGEAKPAAAEEPAAERPKASDIIGGALGGRLGGFGGRKRKDQDREQMPQKSAGAASPEGGMLMEMTIETLQVSSLPVDASKLAVPAGFQQVESDMLKAMQRRR